MGRERRGTRQHLYISTAGLIIVILCSCAPFRTMPAGEQNCTHLQSVQHLLRQGDFEGALRETQKALSVSPKSPPGDAALFNMGLIHAHYANPKKDYAKALGFFTRLKKDFPGSPLVEEAKIWIGVFETMEKVKQIDIEIEEKKKELTR